MIQNNLSVGLNGKLTTNYKSDTTDWGNRIVKNRYETSADLTKSLLGPGVKINKSSYTTTFDSKGKLLSSGRNFDWSTHGRNGRPDIMDKKERDYYSQQYKQMMKGYRAKKEIV